MSRYDPLDALDAAQEELDRRVFEDWCEAVDSAYKLALVERLAELRGSRIRTLDGRVMHPFSEQLGVALMCQRLLPELAVLELDPLVVRRQAQADAREQFAREEAVKHGWIAQ